MVMLGKECWCVLKNVSCWEVCKGEFLAYILRGHLLEIYFPLFPNSFVPLLERTIETAWNKISGWLGFLVQYQSISEFHHIRSGQESSLFSIFNSRQIQCKITVLQTMPPWTVSKLHLEPYIILFSRLCTLERINYNQFRENELDRTTALFETNLISQASRARKQRTSSKHLFTPAPFHNLP